MLAIQVSHLSKEYSLGTVGHGTLQKDMQSWWAKIRGKEDPNTLLGSVPTVPIRDRFLALNDVSFDIRRGEAVAVIGKNGAGKSTLLKVLSRIVAPDKGVARLRGKVSSLLEVGTGFHPEQTGRDNVYMNGAILGMSRQDIAKRFDEIVAFSEIEEFIDTPVKRYSSGMRVRLAFSIAAHFLAEIVILDEVLSVGDAFFQKKSMAKMETLLRNEGRTLLFVSHSFGSVKKLCQRGLLLEHGRLVLDAPVKEVLEAYLPPAKKAAS
ncbi:MAG: ABC transporter ATP-binding protein [Planctomycetaceae bacterium]|jgi:lipopolysaccharide transport system ATP-binding protein|nr:ABC transporter ATP-binding protein [Planctomycetaceae bacterium]